MEFAVPGGFFLPEAVFSGFCCLRFGLASCLFDLGFGSLVFSGLRFCCLLVWFRF